MLGFAFLHFQEIKTLLNLACPQFFTNCSDGHSSFYLAKPKPCRLPISTTCCFSMAEAHPTVTGCCTGFLPCPNICLQFFKDTFLRYLFPTEHSLLDKCLFFCLNLGNSLSLCNLSTSHFQFILKQTNKQKTFKSISFQKCSALLPVFQHGQGC